jgi:hypothetical protein
MELTIREDIAKDFMFRCFIPALHTLVSRNVEKYKQWGGNTCRQSAVFGTHYLNMFLVEYEWTVWDGIFDDIIRGKSTRYNHAWIMGKDRNTGRRLLVDLSRVAHERLFIVVLANRYPKDHEDYKNMKEVSREQLDWRKMIEEDREYYTALSGEEFIQELNKLMGI